MPTTYLIGGAPRSGKTTVIERLITQKPMLAASTDAIRSVAKGMISPELNPRLFKVARGTFGSKKHIDDLRHRADEVLTHELAEAEETWRSVMNFVAYYQRDGKDTAIEGVAVLPKELSKLNFEYKAVLFVNLSDQTETILTHAKAHENDWLNKYDEETVRLYCRFNQLWNKYYYEEANKYNLPVVEVNNNNFSASIQQAVNILLG